MVELRDPNQLGALSARLRPEERPNPDALVSAALEAMRMSAHANAAALLDAALLSDPRHPRAWAARGMLEEREGHLDGAARAYETALALEDRDALSALALAQIYARGAHKDRARALLNFLVLEESLPLEVKQKVIALKRQLDAERAGA
ncbi:MAG: hypothetical protein U1E65_33240 [Myxococcota bacterium]